MVFDVANMVSTGITGGVFVLYKVGELFCGAGGLALGAKNAKLIDTYGNEYGCRIVWANDMDHWACETYRYNIGAHVIEGRVEDLDFNELEPIDGLLFGFPCNDFSVVGEHKGFDGRYGPLYKYGVKAIEAHNPIWFLAENVSGIASANEGKAFVQILQDLSLAGRHGYRVTAHLYKFEEYGVPQMRHRVIVVGIRKDLGLTFRVPAPTTPQRFITAAEALEGVEKVKLNNERTRHSKRTVEMLKHIPPGGNAWHPNVPEELRLNVKNCRLSNIYRRLEPDKPAPTITARGGGGTHGYHWEEPRALTNRERARLQTFPDDFLFLGPKEEVRSQIGMAVPPRAAQVIVEAILKTLAGIEYEYVEAKWAVDHTNQVSLPLVMDGVVA